MKIGIELFKGKLLKDNTNPIAIRLTHNKKTKYKFISVSCKAKNWNSTKKVISCRESDYKIKNEIIKREFNRIAERLNYFEQNNLEFDFDFIISNKDIESYSIEINNNVSNFDSDNFIDIIKARISSYNKIKTRENYQAFLNVMLKLYGSFININSINQYFALEFRNKLDEANYSANHKNSLIKCFTSSYKFGVENRWITRPYVFSLKKYAHEATNRDITFEDFTKIIGLFKKQILANFDVKYYESLAIFCLDIAFQGLSPFDLANIKISDLELCVISNIDPNFEAKLNDEKYQYNIENNQEFREVIKIRTYRAKTNTFVPICCDYNTIRPVLYYLCKGKTSNDYLINCFSINKEYSEKQYHNRCGSYFLQLSNKLNPFLHEIGMNNKVTYYIARHAFINALDKMNIPHDLIRKMVGHKTNTLEKSYINKPTDWEQSEVIFKIFNQYETIQNLELQAKGERVCNIQWRELELFLTGKIHNY